MMKILIKTYSYQKFLRQTVVIISKKNSEANNLQRFIQNLKLNISHKKKLDYLQSKKIRMKLKKKLIPRNQMKELQKLLLLFNKLVAIQKIPN